MQKGTSCLNGARSPPPEVFKQGETPMCTECDERIKRGMVASLSGATETQVATLTL